MPRSTRHGSGSSSKRVKQAPRQKRRESLLEMAKKMKIDNSTSKHQKMKWLLSLPAAEQQQLEELRLGFLSGKDISACVGIKYLWSWVCEKLKIKVSLSAFRIWLVEGKPKRKILKCQKQNRPS